MTVISKELLERIDKSNNIQSVLICLSVQPDKNLFLNVKSRTERLAKMRGFLGQYDKELHQLLTSFNIEIEILAALCCWSVRGDRSVIEQINDKLFDGTSFKIFPAEAYFREVG